MDADLDTLATALYVTIDDLLQQAPHLAPWRPAVGIPPKLSDAELVTLAVMQALLGFNSEARWLRHADRHLRHLFPYLPGQSGYNKRLRRTAELLRQVIRTIACDTTLWSDDVWVVDSTPVECGPLAPDRHAVRAGQRTGPDRALFPLPCRRVLADLAADLPAWEVPRAGIGRCHPIVGMHVDVGGAGPHRGQHRRQVDPAAAVAGVRGPWGWRRLDEAALRELHDKLRGLETMTAGEVFGPNRLHKHIPIEDLPRDASRRLQELQLDDQDGLCELRIKGASRVWGFRRANVIHVLWWDPDHTVFPGNR